MPSNIHDFALRTSGANQNTLVATYLGGECDTDVTLVSQESAAQVDVGLRVPVVESGRPCSAVGVPRTLRVTLDTPLAGRAVVINGRKFIPFDGGLVLFPTRLPDGGLTLTGERGHNDSADGSDATATTSWTLTFGDQTAGRQSPDGQCLPSKGEVIISVAPSTPASDVGWAPIGTAEVRGNSANISSSPPDSGPTRIMIAWPEQGLEYQLWSTTVCQGDTPPTWQELLAIAQSLQPDA